MPDDETDQAIAAIEAARVDLAAVRDRLARLPELRLLTDLLAAVGCVEGALMLLNRQQIHLAQADRGHIIDGPPAGP